MLLTKSEYEKPSTRSPASSEDGGRFQTATSSSSSSSVGLSGDEDVSTAQSANVGSGYAPPSKRTQGTKRSNHWRWRVIIALLSVSVGIVSLVLWRQWHISQIPYKSMRLFSMSEATKNNIDNDIMAIELDVFKQRAQAACTEGQSAVQVRNSLNAQMFQIPKELREKVIEAAVIEGMSTTSSVQDTSNTMHNDGTAYNYNAWWSTTYKGDRSLVGSRYTSCVIVSSITIQVAETVAGFEEEERQMLVGSEPCNCGYFYCEICPVFSNRKFKKPIFKRYVLTLKDQMDLHKLMVRAAIECAQRVLNIPLDTKSLGMTVEENNQNGWENPIDDDGVVFSEQRFINNEF